jgi:hypothetical protein
MPIRLGKRGRASLGLMARLLIFLAVTYFAIDFLLLRPMDEGELVLINQDAISSQFRTPAYGEQERALELFGLTLASIRTVRSEVGWEVRKGKPVLWINDGQGFSPSVGTSVLPRPGTNYIDYLVVHPLRRAEWRFRVDHTIKRRIQFGPFQFKTGPKPISYWSPIMTNTLAEAAAAPISAKNRSN